MNLWKSYSKCLKTKHNSGEIFLKAESEGSEKDQIKKESLAVININVIVKYFTETMNTSHI